MSRQRFSPYLMALLLASAFYSCKKNTALIIYQPVENNKSDSVRIFNLLPLQQTKGYVLYLNDTLSFASGAIISGTTSTTTTFKYATPAALVLPAALRSSILNLKLFLVDEVRTQNKLQRPSLSANAQPILQYSLARPSVGSGTTTLFIYDSLGTITTKFLPTLTEKEAQPGEGKFKLRVINFGYTLPPNQPQYGLHRQAYSVSVQKGDSTSIPSFTTLAFGTTSDYQEFEYGTYQFRVLNDRSNNYLNFSGYGNDLTSAFYPPTYLDPFTRKNSYYPEPARLVRKQENSINLGSPGIRLGNVSSYAFAPGGSYTLLVVGDMYTVSLDQQSVPSASARLAKVRLVHAATDLGDLHVRVKDDSKASSSILSYGSVADPQVLKSGLITASVEDIKGKKLTDYTFNAPPLSFTCLYIINDQNGLPAVYQENVQLDSEDDYLPVPRRQLSGPPLVLSDALGNSPFIVTETARVSYINLSSDAGTLSFTNSLQGTNQLAVSLKTSSSDYNYKPRNQIVPYDEFYSTVQTADQFNTFTPAITANLSFNRPDNLAGMLLDEIKNPFTKPGSYSAVLIGKAFGKNPVTKAKILLIKHSNYRDAKNQ